MSAHKTLDIKTSAVSKAFEIKSHITNEIITQIKINWQLYLLILLPLAYIVLFKYMPMYGAQIAFKKYMPMNGIMGSPWVGFEHFIKFFNSYQFWTLIDNTLRLSLYSLLVGFPVPIILAISLNYTENRVFKKTVQMATYIPNFISVIVMVGITMQLLNTRTGVVNQIICFFTGGTIDFLGNPAYFRSLYAWTGVWQYSGWNSIIYIAALTSVDPQLHEAAIVDGATKLQRIRNIDIPGIMPTAVIVFILNFGQIMTTGFEKVLLMQNPLNIKVSEVFDTYVYNIGLASQISNFSYPAAIGLIQSVITFVLVILVNKAAKTLNETSLW